MSIQTDRSLLQDEARGSTRVRSSSPTSETAAERLTDDLLVEIHSRVPVKSLCRFKCVSNYWLSLIEHPDHRKKLPQTLAGFFYCSTGEERHPKLDLHLFDVSGSRRRPLICATSLDFPPNYRVLYALDCCNGLLLCRWYDAATADRRYVVCNPATGERVTLLAPKLASNVKLRALRLGFDPTVSSHFYVFALLQESHLNFAGVYLYSSENGRWVHNKKGWIKHNMLRLLLPPGMVFLNGRLHFQAYSSEGFFCIGAVDAKGETRMHLPIPDPDDKYDGFLQQSQGCLHYGEFQKNKDGIVARLVVYVLEDYYSKKWVLKHSVETSYIFGVAHVTDSRGLAIQHIDPRWMAMHPECNMIFFATGQAATLMCYNMDRREARVICNLDGHLPQFSYVPLYAELRSLHKLTSI